MLPPVTVVGYDPVRPVSFQNDTPISGRQPVTDPTGVSVASETGNPVLPVGPLSDAQGAQQVQNTQDQRPEVARANEPAGPPPAFEITLMEKREAEEAAAANADAQRIPEEQQVTENAESPTRDDESPAPLPQPDGPNAQAIEAYRIVMAEAQKPTIDLTF